MKVKVCNYWGVPNQFVIYTNEGKYFQSYESIIVFIPNDGTPVRLGSDWEYSRTTGKYRNLFLNETIAETRQKLKDGIYILDSTLTIGDKEKFNKVKKANSFLEEKVDLRDSNLNYLFKELESILKELTI